MKYLSFSTFEMYSSIFTDLLIVSLFGFFPYFQVIFYPFLASWFPAMPKHASIAVIVEAWSKRFHLFLSLLFSTKQAYISKIPILLWFSLKKVKRSMSESSRIAFVIPCFPFPVFIMTFCISPAYLLFSGWTPSIISETCAWMYRTHLWILTMKVYSVHVVLH